MIALGLALLCWPTAAQCQSLADANHFITKLYQAYGHSEPDYLGPQRKRIFSPRLLGLIQRDQDLTAPGDVGYLDGDPICDCQDPAGLSKVRVRLAAAGPGRSRAVIHFRLSDDRRALTLDLVAVRGQWRVDDVHSQDTPSLADALWRAHPPKPGERR